LKVIFAKKCDLNSFFFQFLQMLDEIEDWHGQSLRDLSLVAANEGNETISEKNFD
jgi:hypothetical protein